MLDVKEFRSICISDLAIREITNEEQTNNTLFGIAISYGKSSDDLGGYREIISPGAFSGFLNRDVRCLWNHETGKPLGRTKNNTLRLTDTKEGIAFECDLPNTTWGNDALASVTRGDVNSMSFGFITRKDDWVIDEETNMLVRHILEAELFEVSPVTFPAYPDNTAEARSIMQEGAKRALIKKDIPIEIYKRKLKLKEFLGGF